MKEAMIGKTKDSNNGGFLLQDYLASFSASSTISTVEHIRPGDALLLFCLQKHIDSKISRQVKNLVQRDIDWSYLFQLSHRHGLIPLLYKSLEATCSKKVPEEMLTKLKDRFKKNALRNLYLVGELFKTLDLFEMHGIPAIPFKGPVLAVSAYGDLTLREFVDLDIFIHKKDVLDAKLLLVSQGYQPIFDLTSTQEVAYLQSSCEYSFSRNRDGTQVEIHWEILPKYFSFPIDTKSFWGRLKPVWLAGHEILTFMPEDMLLIQCMHGTKHCWEQLKWVLDVATLINTHKDLDWDGIIENARQHGSERMLFLGLFLASGLLGACLPKRVLQKFEDNKLLEKLAAKVCRGLFSNGDNGAEGFQEHLFYYKIRERPTDKFRYALRRLITSTNINDWKFLNLPAFLSPIYYLIRPIRLSSYLLGFLKYIWNGRNP